MNQSIEETRADLRASVLAGRTDRATLEKALSTGAISPPEWWRLQPKDVAKVRA